MKKRIPFVDLQIQYPLIKAEIEEKFSRIIESARFVSGQHVREFEECFAAYVGCKHCIATVNGTVALQLSLMLLDIGPGDEVIVPVNSFIATAEAVSLAGATPIFVDINEETYHLDLEDVARKISRKTRAIVPVHLYGHCVGMDPILKLAKANNLVVIEDAAQAHGAKYKGRHAGSFGRCAAFSFYPGKNLGAWGDAGAVTTNEDSLARKMRLFINHGSEKKYHHEILGGNYRMSEFQGAVLSSKLKHLDLWNQERRALATLYSEYLDKKNFILPKVASQREPVWHIYPIRCSNRDGLAKYLDGKDIDSIIHYPIPIHLTEAYRHFGLKEGTFPVAEKVQSEILSLPLYPGLTDDEVRHVSQIVNRFYFSEQ